MRGQRIKEVRKRAHLTQEQLAKKCGLATITIRQYENGKRNPSIDQIALIAEALGVSIVELLGQYAFRGDREESIIDANRTLIEISDLDYSFSEAEQALVRSFSQLNPTGQQKAVERVEELTEIPKYQRQPSQEAAGAHTAAQGDNDTPAPETPSERKETPPQAEARDGEGTKEGE